MLKRRKLLLTFIIIAFLASACGVGPGVSPSVPQSADLKIDQRFREFYDYLGGKNVLGPPISQKLMKNGREYQYTSNALLMYVPDAAESQRYQLAALGVELGISEAPMSPDAPNGHEIHTGFLDLYTRLGGARFAGLPITDVQFNSEANRIEQYFENVGFYQYDGAPAEDVRLLAYGSWKCANYCGYNPGEDAILLQSTAVAPGFSDAVKRLDSNFIGYPLTEEYTAFDGMIEQIFENVVIIANPSSPGKIQFRPILGMLGVAANGGGYSVPDIFDEYIKTNSGYEFSGPVISEYTALSADVYRQCFTNYCLDYHQTGPEELRVRLASLGFAYKNQYYENRAGGNFDAQRNVTMRIWEQYPLLASDQIQEIGVSISAGDEPLKNFEPVMTLMIPDIGEVVYRFPPTNSEGNSVVELNPINAPNSTRIEYEICVTSVADRFCIADDFMIWGNP